MNKKHLTRHAIREKALQTLFPLDFNSDLQKQDAIAYVLALDHQEIINADGDRFVPEYLDVLVEGVCQHKLQLDEIITRHLGENWTVSRIAKMDLVILRIAIFEMLYIQTVPNTVALNEAIELTKLYSDDQSRKFVNGVLANVMEEIETTNTATNQTT